MENKIKHTYKEKDIKGCKVKNWHDDTVNNFLWRGGQLENLDTGDVFVHEMHSTWNNDKVKQLEVELEETKHLLSKSKTLIADMVMYNLDDRPESYNDVMKQAQELLTELKDY